MRRASVERRGEAQQAQAGTLLRLLDRSHHAISKTDRHVGQKVLLPPRIWKSKSIKKSEGSWTSGKTSTATGRYFYSTLRHLFRAIVKSQVKKAAWFRSYEASLAYGRGATWLGRCLRTRDGRRSDCVSAQTEAAHTVRPIPETTRHCLPIPARLPGHPSSLGSVLGRIPATGQRCRTSADRPIVPSCAKTIRGVQLGFTTEEAILFPKNRPDACNSPKTSGAAPDGTPDRSAVSVHRSGSGSFFGRLALAAGQTSNPKNVPGLFLCPADCRGTLLIPARTVIRW